ncbi:hypothetical protein EGH82_08245 [Vibrio ponticus]|uniref:Uncharacterized protein n=1 Tax=Vibrio ponticus TaxID=265668 RepID=A0A3N3E1Y6_9VIBR|nr:hypothetical protein EGH82_08245 [Vibrio ponticus]
MNRCFFFVLARLIIFYDATLRLNGLFSIYLTAGVKKKNAKKDSYCHHGRIIIKVLHNGMVQIKQKCLGTGQGIINPFKLL